MINSLYISQYALISQLRVKFRPGFTVMTGETGAGKSIILGAISLIMGQRADSRVIMPGADKCVVEAEFNISKHAGMESFFIENDLDYDSISCVLRREVSAQGKSRAFINDTPVSLTVLRSLSEQLIDVHSQHENLLIVHPHYQLEVVDTIAGNRMLLENYRKSYKSWNIISKELDALVENAANAARDQEYLQFQFSQLDEFGLIEGEQELLENELKILEHAGEIKSTLGSSMDLLQGDEGILSKMKAVQSGITRIQYFLPSDDDKLQRLESAYIELKDIVESLDHHFSRTEVDPQRLEDISVRLGNLYSLIKKFRVENSDNLIALKNEFQIKLLEISSFDDQIEQKQKDKQDAFQLLEKNAGELSNSRTSHFEMIISHMEEQLHKLGMPNARLQISMTRADYNSEGFDSLKILFSANKNHPLQAINQIASGGEISRLMLAVKSLMASRSDLPAIIFDEIDTGISGEIANRMGEIMSDMSKDMQVIAITHLPQIASKGDNHLKVYKEDQDELTRTSLKELLPADRVLEIASMLDGESPGNHALTLAEKMLTSR